jgi:hypothetical protein
VTTPKLLKPEDKASPSEVSRAARDWFRYKAEFTLQKHPELVPEPWQKRMVLSDLVAFFEGQPWNSYSVEGFHTVKGAQASQESLPCEPASTT